jgi:hypothetical protein
MPDSQRRRTGAYTTFGPGFRPKASVSDVGKQTFSGAAESYTYASMSVSTAGTWRTHLQASVDEALPENSPQGRERSCDKSLSCKTAGAESVHRVLAAGRPVEGAGVDSSSPSQATKKAGGNGPALIPSGKVLRLSKSSGHSSGIAGPRTRRLTQWRSPSIREIPGPFAA